MRHKTNKKTPQKRGCNYVIKNNISHHHNIIKPITINPKAITLISLFLFFFKRTKIKKNPAIGRGFLFLLYGAINDTGSLGGPSSPLVR